MAWTNVTIARRGAGVGMPNRCAYCFGAAEQDLELRARRRVSVTKRMLTVTKVDEHVSLDVPFCRADATRSAQRRREIRVIGVTVAVLLAALGLLLILLGTDAPAGVRILLGAVAGVLLGLLGLVATGLLVRRLPRYRDWGAGLLGVDLAAGAEAFTFRFTNPTFAAAFRTRNGLGR
jgi:hypothetical protein